jgi:hypothetical protein
MDYSQYEDYGFERVSAFNLSTGYNENNNEDCERICRTRS